MAYIYCDNFPGRLAFQDPVHPTYYTCTCPRGFIYEQVSRQLGNKENVSGYGRCANATALPVCKGGCSQTREGCAGCRPVGIVNFPYSRHKELYLAFSRYLDTEGWSIPPSLLYEEYSHGLSESDSEATLRRVQESLQDNKNIWMPHYTLNSKSEVYHELRKLSTIEWDKMDDIFAFNSLIKQHIVVDKLGSIQSGDGRSKDKVPRILCWQTPFYEGHDPIPKLLGGKIQAAAVEEERANPSIIPDVNRIVFGNLFYSKTGKIEAKELERTHSSEKRNGRINIPSIKWRYAFADPLRPWLNTCTCPEGYAYNSFQQKCVEVCPPGTWDDILSKHCVKYKNAPEGMILSQK